MQQIGDIKTETKPKTKNIGRRHVLVGDINEKLKLTSFKKISLARLGALLSPYTEEQLLELHSVCNNAKNYAAMFWWHVVPKKHETNSS